MNIELIGQIALWVIGGLAALMLLRFLFVIIFIVVVSIIACIVEK